MTPAPPRRPWRRPWSWAGTRVVGRVAIVLVVVYSCGYAALRVTDQIAYAETPDGRPLIGVRLNGCAHCTPAPDGTVDALFWHARIAAGSVYAPLISLERRLRGG